MLHTSLETILYYHSNIWGSVIWAEDQYFPQLPNATWDEARLYCQSCFRELTTITSRNVHLIVTNLSSDYWVGLRRRYNGSIPWKAWSNGDPVTYQNWYPGHPIPNKEKKQVPICSSTTESPMSTVITTTTATPMTSLETSTVTSSPVTIKKTSTIFHTVKPDDTCPILNDMLECLNMTCDELESVITMCMSTTTVTPKITTYNTTSVVTTFSTTFNAATNRTTTEHATTEGTTTESTTTRSTTASNCIFEPEPDPEHYIEDACVVLLSYGMWEEKECNTSLPYICYEERFFGQIYVSDVNTSAVNLSWTEGPGAKNISHYRVEISEDNNQTFNNTFTQTFNQTFIQTNLSQHIQNLTAGTLYRVQVFPVKCGRDLNPQNISFYTYPSDVQNLAVVGMTTVSAILTWTKPEGNHDFYSVYVKCKSNPSIDDHVEKCVSEKCTVNKLTPGYEYIFTVTAVVNQTIGGVPSSVSDYTIPSTVRNLTSANNDSTVITASWDPPEGGHSGYRYCLTEINPNHICSIASNCSSMTNNIICKNTTERQITESGKSDGSKFCLCVAALTKNNMLSGEMDVIPAYTLPKSVTLYLNPDYKFIFANWSIVGKYEQFKVTIETAAYLYHQDYFTSNTNYSLEGLKAGVNYTVSVVTINGNLTSNPTEKFDYTRPKSPSNLKASAIKTTINVQWEAPTESKDAVIIYLVEYHTRFWNLSITNYTEKTAITYNNLRPGTKYEFSVTVIAGTLRSDTVTVNASTEPEKKTLILTMLCSSQTPLKCTKNVTQDDLFGKLQMKMDETFHDWVYWNLTFINRSPESKN